MPGNHTELTSRLEVSRRQFFQWFLVEKLQMPEVKAKMDELTRVLRLAGYDHNFIAEEKSWRSRSRHWNTLGKNAWKVGPHQKGSGLPIPTELSNVPVWIEWDQDVGDWRKSESNESHLSHFSVTQADEHQEPHQNTSHYDGTTQYSTNTQARDDFDSFHTSPALSPKVPRYPQTSSPTEILSASPRSLNTGPTTWLQQNAAPFTNFHPPMFPLPEQTHTTQPQAMDGSNIWYPNYPTATTASTPSVPLSNTARGKDTMEMAPQTCPTSSSASYFPNYTYEDPHGYQNRYAPLPSSLSNHHQHQHPATDLSTAQSPHLQAPLWTADQWNSAQYESASSQDQNGGLSATKDAERGGF